MAELRVQLMYLPAGLFGVSIATATLPAVSRYAARNDTPAASGGAVRVADRCAIGAD